MHKIVPVQKPGTKFVPSDSRYPQLRQRSPKQVLVAVEIQYDCQLRNVRSVILSIV